MSLLRFLISKQFFFFVVYLLSWQVHALTLTSEEKQWIAQNPTITLGSDYAWPPYDFVDKQNRHVGISADIIELIRQKTGLNIHIKSGVWSEIISQMKAGQLDGLVCAVETPERLNYLNFTLPYTVMPLGIIVKEGVNGIQGMADLKNKLVAVNKGSYLHEWLQSSYPDIPLYLTHSNEASLHAVSFGQAEVYVGNLAVATYIIKQQYLTNLQVVAKVDGLETKTAIAIDKNNPILMAIIQKALSTIEPSKIRAINERWYAKSQSNQPEQWVKLTEKERAWIASYGEVSIAAESDWPPFDFVDENQQPVGLSLDYLQLIGQKTGLTFNITVDRWIKNLSHLEHKKVDLLPAAFKTAEREQFAFFSDPYFEARYYFFVRDDLQVAQLSELKGLTVAVPKGFAQITTLQKNYPGIHILETESMQAAIEAVVQNKAQMLYEIYPVLSHFLKESGINTIVPFKVSQQIMQNLSFMIRNDAPELLSIVNKGLAAITPAERKRLEAKWLTKQASFTSELKLTAKEQEWIRSHGTINVASETSWPPFNFEDFYQNPVGLSMDYLNLIAQKTGLQLNVVSDSWDTNLRKLKNKQADLLPSGVKTEERARFALFSDPYFEASHYFFIRDDIDAKQLKDLNGKTVAIPKGFASIELIQKNYPNISILETPSMQEAIEAVLQNRAQLLYGLYPSISYSLRKTGVNSIKPFKATPHGIRYVRFIIRNDMPELLSIINKGLAAMSVSERERIRSEWIAKRPEFGVELGVELTSIEKEWLQKNDTISFAGDPDWLPFEAFTEDGRYIGIVSDFLKEVEKKLPVVFEPVLVSSWQETLALSEQKKVLVISGDVDDTHLAQNYSPIEPYVNSPIVIVMRSDADFVGSLDELKTHSLAIVKGYGYTHKLFKEFPEHNFVVRDDPLKVLKSVVSGHSDAALLSLPVASYLIKQHGFYDLKIVGKTSVEMGVTLFVVKEDPVLHQILNKVMKKLSEEGGGGIIHAWTKLNFASKVDYWLIFQIILIALFFVGFVFYWNLKLAREIKQRKAIEQQLSIEKDKFKHLFEKATDGHLIYQRGKFVVCNQAALTLLGLTDKEELLNQDITNWSPEYQQDGELSSVKRKRLIQNCFNQGMQRFDWMLKDVYGHVFWVDVVYTSIPYLGKPAVYISWRDKTEQKALEERLKQNEAQIKLLIDSIPLIVVVTDVEGKVLSANRKALDDYRVTPEQLSTLNISDFYQHRRDQNEINKQLRLEGRVEQKIVTMKDFQGHSREMMLSVIPIKYHNQSALLSISVDLTERINTEKQLKDAMDKAEAANQSKTEFLANMSHEIRTPMNAILGFTELLNEQIKEPRLKSFVGTIQSAGNTLLMLINDILDLSKIEAGKMTLNKVATNPHELFKEVGEIFSMNIQKKGLDFYIEIDPDIPQSVLLDPVRLRQVLFNLLGNAVKFTETGFVKLSVQSLAVFNHLSKMNLLIKVEDTGIGIPFDQQDRIFNVFEQQVGQDTGKFGGTGLGLSITKRLVSMMQGHLSLESIPNQGSTFSILLEKLDVASVLANHALEPPLPFNAKTVRFKSATILVVDDVLNNRELICQNFIGTGIEIIQAEDGQQAIEQYKKHAIDLILMDIRMPVLNGYEAAKVIKSLNATVPIIALTASVMQDEFEKVRRTYFDDYLRKPVLRNDLIQALMQFLEYREEEREDKLSSTTRQEFFELSEQLTQQMKRQFSELYVQSVESNSLEDIKAFSLAIASFAKKNDHDSLATFASQLLEKVDSFDISGMQFLLKQYGSMVQDK